MKDPGNEVEQHSVADPDLELRKRVGGGGGVAFLIYLPHWLFSPPSFRLFLPKIRGKAGPLGPPSSPGPLDPPMALQSLDTSLA